MYYARQQGDGLGPGPDVIYELQDETPFHTLYSQVLTEVDIEVPSYGSLKVVTPRAELEGLLEDNCLYTEALEEERERVSVSVRKRRARR